MSEREPSRDELLAMAYADGELAPDARAEFEGRLAADPRLRQAVSELRELELLARAAAPREPMDHEWAALARDPTQRGTLGLGWTLLGGGATVLAGYALYVLFTSDGPPVLKFALSALALGFLALFGATLRARLCTLPLDPYRKVRR